MATSAMVLLVPSSATYGGGGTGSVSATGKVTYSAATTVRVDGVFSSTYNRYLIVMAFSCSNNNPEAYARLSVGGVLASGSDYAHQYLNVNATSVVGQRNYADTTVWVFGYPDDSGANGWHIFLANPGDARPTIGRHTGMNGFDGARINDSVLYHSLSTAYDGILIGPRSGGTITGMMTVYGFVE